jgi:hypothetical protein
MTSPAADRTCRIRRQKEQYNMQRTDEVRPDLPVAPAPKAPKKKGKALKIVGIIVGGFVVLSAISAALPKQEGPAAAPVVTPADSTNGNESPTVDEPATPTEPTTAPEIVEPQLTAGQKNAISAAKSYLEFEAFSESGLIDQLKFEKYSAADAQFAVNHITVDWNEQAAKSAKSYLDISSFSRQGLIDQLEFEGFTTQQAIYGVNTTGL